jgi:hypothetical protein
VELGDDVMQIGALKCVVQARLRDLVKLASVVANSVPMATGTEEKAPEHHRNTTGTENEQKVGSSIPTTGI